MKLISFYKYLLLLIIITSTLTTSTQLFAQKETYNWYFGYNSGITFMPDGQEAKFLPNGEITGKPIISGTATLSDRNGNLLFYSDGNFVWNKNHQILRNGGGLKGHVYSSRSVIIVPKPSSNQYYYIFTIGCFEMYKEEPQGNYIYDNGISYSIIDILADNGKGDIAPDDKNIKLLDNAVDKMITINHSNKQDIWLVTYNWKDNYFYVYLLTKDGIKEERKIERPFPRFSVPVPNYAGFNLEYDFTNKKLISCDVDINSFVIYDFNPEYGLIGINNPIVIPASDDSTLYRPYSAAISEDGSKFYGSCYGRAIIQWDLFAGDNDAIIESRTTICDTNTENANNINFGTIRKGSDNKMYIARHRSNYLAMINEPNEAGEYCNFADEGIYLEGTQSGYGLPIMMNYNLAPCDFTGYAGGNKNLCVGSDIKLGSNFDTTNLTFQWTPAMGLDNPNILNPTCKIAQTTQYVLMIRDNVLECIDYDTIVVTIQPLPNIIKAGDITACKNSPFVIGSNNNNPNYIYRWTPTDYLENPNERSTLCSVEKNAIYILSILDTTTGCYNYDTINVFINNLDTFELLGSMFICEGKNTTISVKDDFVSYYWSTGESTKSITIDKIGIYEVIVTDAKGCSGKRIFEITYLEADNFHIVAPNTICSGIETILKTNVSFAKYNWSTGETTPTISIHSAGTYWVFVENDNGCSATDTVTIDETEIHYSFPPEIIFPTICNDIILIPNIFVNNGNEDIVIDNISISNSLPFKIDEVFSLPIVIKPNNKLTITTIFDGSVAGTYNDTLRITLSSPCNATILVPISGSAVEKNNISVTVPHLIKATPQIGENKTTISIVLSGAGIPLWDSGKNASIKCSYRRDMIQVYATNTGTITDIIQNGLIETIKIINLFPTDTGVIDLQLFANVSLGRDTLSDIIFFDFESDISCAGIDSTIIPFELYGCMIGARIFDFFETTELLVETRDNYFDCQVSSEEEGSFNLSIYNLLGERVKEINWFKSNTIFEEKTILINNSDLSLGSYFILLRSPNYYINRRVLILNSK